MTQIKKTATIVEELMNSFSGHEPLNLKQLSEDVIVKLEQRLEDEFKAHYFYMCAGNWCNNQGYINAGTFFLNESNSELQHAKLIQDYLVQWNIQPTIPKVETNFEFESLIQIINQSYELEYDLLLKYANDSQKLILKDIITFDFLQQFRQIQNDSVKEFSDLLNVLRLIDYNDKYQLLYFENNYFKG